MTRKANGQIGFGAGPYVAKIIDLLSEYNMGIDYLIDNLTTTCENGVASIVVSPYALPEI